MNFINNKHRRWKQSLTTDAVCYSSCWHRLTPRSLSQIQQAPKRVLWSNWTIHCGEIIWRKASRRTDHLLGSSVCLTALKQRSVYHQSKTPTRTRRIFLHCYLRAEGQALREGVRWHWVAHRGNHTVVPNSAAKITGTSLVVMLWNKCTLHLSSLPDL